MAKPASDERACNHTCPLSVPFRGSPAMFLSLCDIKARMRRHEYRGQLASSDRGARGTGAELQPLWHPPDGAGLGARHVQPAARGDVRHPHTARGRAHAQRAPAAGAQHRVVPFITFHHSVMGNACQHSVQSSSSATQCWMHVHVEPSFVLYSCGCLRL